MRTDTPTSVHLKNYTPPDYLIEQTDLRIELAEPDTTVTARLRMRRNPRHRGPIKALTLCGQALQLDSVRLDGCELGARRYRVDEESLTLLHPPKSFTLELVTRIRPQDNTSLEGLYRSGGTYCTQCEAEGFRKITYYLDRPDVMSRFSTMIIADAAACPVLLSNGNPVQRGELPGNRHWVKWEDPHKKPAYLFALVAGDLVHLEDEYVTASGRKVSLRIYVEHGNLDKCDHAMTALKQAMQWDEEVFGLEYDLDIYMIVAVSDFNMGAMENKGLNVFNTAYVLAKPQTATDTDYEQIQGVIGHEYFHNWTGNRVTCRDWFQLSLKEGLTVFRDQEFSADMTSRGVTRINDVRVLRSAQFPEDAGPMAHPVRPDSYIEISNFYTATVYNKGAEVVRMIHTLVGREGFRRGMDLYFARHDGQAVTTDDFVAAMADANGVDLSQFKRWYTQAGTPVLTVKSRYDAHAQTYALEVTQQCPPTPGQPNKQPFHIPLAVGLLDHQGNELPLRLEGERATGATTRILELYKQKETFRFRDIPAEPVPSLLRGFSAPVKLEADLDADRLGFLAAHDTDPFNRWEAGQRLATRVVVDLIADHQAGKELSLEPSLLDAFEKTLADENLDPALIAEALMLPSETYLAELMDTVDVDAIHVARLFLRRSLAAALKSVLLKIYEENTLGTPYTYDPKTSGRRHLKNTCLGYLVELDDPVMTDLALAQFNNADNMTDELASLRALANKDCPQRHPALDAFYTKWQHEPLVVDKWFGIQAMSRLPDTLNEVKNLVRHPAFDLRNPNKVRAVIGTFSRANPVRFHDSSGAGYRFVADQILALDPLNPQVAARLAGSLSRWQKLDDKRKHLIRDTLSRIKETPGLSRDVFEIVSKSLR